MVNEEGYMSLTAERMTLSKGVIATAMGSASLRTSTGSSFP